MAHERLLKHQEHMKTYYDKTQNDVNFRVGDQVYLYVPVVKEGLSKKLSKFWRGPFIIAEKISPVNYKLRWVSTNRLLRVPVHANRLKRLVSRHEFPSEDDVPPGGETFPPLDIHEDELRDDPIIENRHSDPEYTPPPPPEQSGVPPQAVKRKCKKSTKVYSIAKILGKRINDSGQTEYKVRWANYGPTHDSFEPHDNLDVTTKKYVRDNDGIIPTCT